jgi:hypothetical protein
MVDFCALIRDISAASAGKRSMARHSGSMSRATADNAAHSSGRSRCMLLLQL